MTTEAITGMARCDLRALRGSIQTAIDVLQTVNGGVCPPATTPDMRRLLEAAEQVRLELQRRGTSLPA